MECNNVPNNVVQSLFNLFLYILYIGTSYLPANNASPNNNNNNNNTSVESILTKQGKAETHKD
jgi:hypothetical protein